MKIYGPYTRKDGRKHIVKIEDGNRVTQSYPRYLMELHLGRKLLPTEEVDHINHDFTDNRLENLQILSGKENKQKEMSRETRQAIRFTGYCPLCGKYFERPLSRVKYNNKESGPFCSRQCSGLHNSRQK